MPLPPLIEEDVRVLEGALDELLRKSEAAAALVIDKGGPIICQRGTVDQFDTTTIAALAAGSFSATQAIAERLGDNKFSSIYQQGETHSTIFSNIDEDVLLIAIFGTAIAVGVVKHYAVTTVEAIHRQLDQARLRSPGQGVDLVSLNSPDLGPIFRRKAD